jgi:hypothetical protein
MVEDSTTACASCGLPSFGAYRCPSCQTGILQFSVDQPAPDAAFTTPRNRGLYRLFILMPLPLLVLWSAIVVVGGLPWHTLAIPLVVAGGVALRVYAAGMRQ